MLFWAAPVVAVGRAPLPLKSRGPDDISVFSFVFDPPRSQRPRRWVAAICWGQSRSRRELNCGEGFSGCDSANVAIG